MMTLSDRQIMLVQDSFELVIALPQDVTDLFYARVFELDPTLRPMFKRDISEKGRMLMQTIIIAVHSLKDLANITPALHTLGHRHIGYGVKKKDYDTLGMALIWTIEQGIGPTFTPELRDAWAVTYNLLVQTITQDTYELPRE